MRPPSPPARWSPREDLPGQTDLIPALDRLAAEASAAARGANGGPSLEPSYDDLARIARPVLGDLWEGKLAPHIGEDPRTLRRWRHGEGRPSARTVAWAKAWAMRTALHLLTAADEEDLADAVRRRQGAVARGAQERGRLMLPTVSLAKPVSLARLVPRQPRPPRAN